MTKELNYIIANENKLGYTIGTSAQNSTGVRIAILAVDCLAGGDPTLIGNTTFALKKDIRPATKEDGQRFRVKIV